VTAVAFALTVVAVFVIGRVMSWREVHRQRTDTALVIKPPRIFVDADGRSDYRPELPALAAQRRTKEHRL